jgi:hypothetical protein
MVKYISAPSDLFKNIGNRVSLTIELNGLRAAFSVPWSYSAFVQKS